MSGQLTPIPRVQTVDGTPSFALHLFSVACLVMLFNFAPASETLFFFLLPSFLISFVILFWTRDPINIFLLSQYSLVSAFAIASVSDRSSTGAVAIFVVLAIALSKIRTRAIIPPLGPVFFYLCISSVFLYPVNPTNPPENHFHFASAYPLWAVLSIYLTARNRLLVTPLFSSLGILFLMWWQKDQTHLFFVLSAVLLLATPYLCRYFRLETKSQNSRVTVLEEFFIAMVLALLIHRTTKIDYDIIYLTFSALYGVASWLLARLVRSTLASEVAAAAAVFSLFLSINRTEVFSSFPLDHAITALIASAFLAFVIIISRSRKASHTDDLAKLLITTQLLILFHRTGFSIGQLSVTTGAVCAGSVVFLTLLACVHEAPRYNYGNVLRGLLAVRDLVVIRRWARSASTFAVNLPIVGALYSGINFLLGRLLRAFGAKQWSVNHFMVVCACFTCMLFFTDWAWLVFRSLPRTEGEGEDAVTKTMDDFLNDEPMTAIYQVAFKLSAFAMFGSALGMIGAKTKFHYLRILAALVPLAGMVWYYLTNKDMTTPWPLFLLGASLLYLGLRFSTGYFIDRPSLNRASGRSHPPENESLDEHRRSSPNRKVVITYDSARKLWIGKAGDITAERPTAESALSELLELKNWR
jgi:hypothetical protein